MSIKNQIESLLESARKEYCFSGFQLHAEKEKDTLSLFGGATSYWPDAKPVLAETFFDLGSLTKVILTTSALARLVDRSEIALTDTLGDLLVPLRNTRYAGLAIADLLTHRSGLIDWYPFFRHSDNWLERVAKNPTEFLISKPGEEVRYSDVGFLLLGAVLEAKLGNLERVFQQEVVDPLSLKEIHWKVTGDAVATEWDLWRGKLVQGEVFDENTAHIGPTRSGHAGLFGSARGLAGFSQAWLKAVQGKSEWLSSTTANLFTTKQRGPSGSTWGLGWDTRSRMGSSAGKLFSSSAFGHLGFPGTSIWIDPEANGICIFLTNRVHPSRADKRIRQLRPKVHDQVFEYWRSIGD